MKKSGFLLVAVSLVLATSTVAMAQAQSCSEVQLRAKADEQIQTLDSVYDQILRLDAPTKRLIDAYNGSLTASLGSRNSQDRLAKKLTTLDSKLKVFWTAHKTQIQAIAKSAGVEVAYGEAHFYVEKVLFSDSVSQIEQSLRATYGASYLENIAAGQQWDYRYQVTAPKELWVEPIDQNRPVPFAFQTGQLTIDKFIRYHLDRGCDDQLPPEPVESLGDSLLHTFYLPKHGALLDKPQVSNASEFMIEKPHEMTAEETSRAKNWLYNN